MNLQSAYCRIVSAIRSLKQAACWGLTPNGCFQYFQIVAARLLHALDTRRRKPIFVRGYKLFLQPSSIRNGLKVRFGQFIVEVRAFIDSGYFTQISMRSISNRIYSVAMTEATDFGEPNAANEP